MDLQTIQERFGHGSMVVTADIYAHVTSKLHKEVAGKTDEVLSPQIPLDYPLKLHRTVGLLKIAASKISLQTADHLV
jgi:hypothetical protein